MSGKISSIILAILLFFTIVSCDNYNNGDFNPNESEFLFMMYLGGDNNNLSGVLNENIQTTIQGLSSLLVNDNHAAVNILILFDSGTSFSSDDETKLYQIRFPRQGKTEVTKRADFTGGNLNSASWETFRDFLIFAKDNYTYDKAILTVGSHGTGIMGTPAGWTDASYGLLTSSSYDDRNISEISKSMVIDNSSDSSWIPDNMFAKALNEAGFNGDSKLDLLLLDLCVEGGIETAYELKDTCKYLLSSPNNIPGGGFPYNQLVKLFTTGNSIKKIAEQAVEIYSAKNYYNSLGFDTLTATDLSKIEEASLAINKLAEYIDANAGKFSDILLSEFFTQKTDEKSISYKETYAYSQDSGYFAQKLKEYAENLPEPDELLSSLCENVTSALENAIIASWRNKIQNDYNSPAENLYDSLNDEGRNYYGLSITTKAIGILKPKKKWGEYSYSGVYYNGEWYYNPYSVSDFAFKNDFPGWTNLLKALYPYQFND